MNKTYNSLYSPLTDANNNSQALTIPDTQISPTNNLALNSDIYINIVNNGITELKASLDTHRIQKNRIAEEKNQSMLLIKNVSYI